LDLRLIYKDKMACVSFRNSSLLGTDSLERPRFYFSSECLLVNDGFERERMIELWKIATLLAENSTHTVGISSTPKSRRQRLGKQVDTRTFLRHSDCFYFRRRINKTWRE